MTLRTALQQGTKLLEDGGINAPRLTAEVLLAHAVHCERSYFYAHPEQELREVEWIHYGRYLHERLKGKPTQYITRVQEFYGRPFRVGPGVLIPRPETELLVELAIPLAREASGIVDVGTGSGAIAATLALEASRSVCAIDISPEALEVAQGNARALGAKVDFALADLLSGCRSGAVGLVISNPPYVAEADRDTLQREVRDFEPGLALFAGQSGLDFYRRLVPEASRVLRPGGYLLMELGAGQGADVAAMLDSASWHGTSIYDDLTGIPRVLLAQRN